MVVKETKIRYFCELLAILRDNSRVTTTTSNNSIKIQTIENGLCEELKYINEQNIISNREHFLLLSYIHLFAPRYKYYNSWSPYYRWEPKLWEPRLKWLNEQIEYIQPE